MSDFNCSYLIFLIIKGENTALIPLDNSHEVFLQFLNYKNILNFTKNFYKISIILIITHLMKYH